MGADFTLPLSAEKLIPHRKPMRMVDRLVEINDGGGVVEALVSTNNPLLNDDARLDRLALAEMIAQAYAVVKGYDDCLAGEHVKTGFLVGIRKVRFHDTAFAGNLLRITVGTKGSFSGFAVVEGEVSRNGRVIAEGEFKLWIQSNPPQDK